MKDSNSFCFTFVFHAVLRSSIVLGYTKEIYQPDYRINRMTILFEIISIDAICHPTTPSVK